MRPQVFCLLAGGVIADRGAAELEDAEGEGDRRHRAGEGHDAAAEEQAELAAADWGERVSQAVDVSARLRQ